MLSARKSTPVWFVGCMLLVCWFVVLFVLLMLMLILDF